jgi:hypothetical protein
MTGEVFCVRILKLCISEPTLFCLLQMVNWLADDDDDDEEDEGTFRRREFTQILSIYYFIH